MNGVSAPHSQCIHAVRKGLTQTVTTGCPSLSGCPHTCMRPMWWGHRAWVDQHRGHETVGWTWGAARKWRRHCNILQWSGLGNLCWPWERTRQGSDRSRGPRKRARVTAATAHFLARALASARIFSGLLFLVRVDDIWGVGVPQVEPCWWIQGATTSSQR